MENKFASNLISSATNFFSSNSDTSSSASSGNEKETLSASCPNCCYRLEFDKKEDTVRCFCCDSSFTQDQLLKSGRRDAAASATSATSFATSIAQLIDSPDAGLIYIQNRFDNVEWDEYCESTEIIIPEIEEMVEKSKIKYGATAKAWQLDFESVSVPLGKKLEGLKRMAENMAEQYSDVDLTGILETFDLYKAIAESIVDHKKALIKRMEIDVAYARQLELDADTLAKMQQTLDGLRAQLDDVKLVKRPQEIPEIAEAQQKIDEKKVRDFASRGIDVKAVYAKACQMAKDPRARKNEVLEMFESIRGYADVNDRIQEINRYYGFNGEYYHFCGRSFIYRKKRKEVTFDPTANGKKTQKKTTAGYQAEEEYSGDIYSLYEVVNGKPSKKPILENITQILTVYANRLYFVKFDASICYFNIETMNTVELDSGRVGDYNYETIYFDSGKTSFYIRKRLPLEIIKAGCIQKLFSKQDEAVARKNNYSLLKVSLTSDLTKTAIPELVDVTECYGTNLFYTRAEEVDPATVAHKKKATETANETEEEEELKLSFRVYNTVTGESRELLSNECEIHNVVDEYVVFTKYAPNPYNKDLYVYHIPSGKEILIENNVLDYFCIIKDRIYYTVGNTDYCPLFSNSLDGTNRVEIMMNVEQIVSTRAGWMYVIKGYGRNAILIKISSDGKRRMVVCTQFQRAIQVTDTYIYYIDTSNALRVARTDGKENILIAHNISASNVIVDKECIYYLRREMVESKTWEASLYRMDMSGHNVRKLLFNVSAIDNFDDNTIMIKRAENALFEFTIPVDKKNTTRTERREYDLTHFCKFNKTSGEVQTVLTLGLPDEGEYSFAKGCFGKTVKYNSTYKQIPRKHSYVRKNVAKAGAVFNEQTAEQGVETKTALNTSAAGCNLFKR